MINTFPLKIVSFYLRRIPGTMFHYRLIRQYLGKMRKAGPLLGVLKIRTRHGFLMKVDTADWLGQYVYLTGTYERATANLIQYLLNTGDTFIDVGANQGFFSLLAAHRVGPSGKVHAFEPVPMTRGMLESNLGLNNYNSIVNVNSHALSDHEGEVEFHVGPATHRGLSSMRSVPESSDTLQLKTGKLDSLIDIKAPIRLIKIDVEGAELLTLKDMRKILSAHKPFLIVEISDTFLQEFGTSARELLAYMKELGYVAYKIKEHHLELINEDSMSLSKQFNALLAMPNSLPGKLESRNLYR